MSYKEYTVRVWDDGTVYWFNENNILHREGGPAIIYPNGCGRFYLNGKYYTEKDYWEKVKPEEEMTIAQIEKELGYKIKIIKEK